MAKGGRGNQRTLSHVCQAVASLQLPKGVKHNMSCMEQRERSAETHNEPGCFVKLDSIAVFMVLLHSIMYVLYRRQVWTRLRTLR